MMLGVRPASFSESHMNSVFLLPAFIFLDMYTPTSIFRFFTYSLYGKVLCLVGILSCVCVF